MLAWLYVWYTGYAVTGSGHRGQQFLDRVRGKKDMGGIFVATLTDIHPFHAPLHGTVLGGQSSSSTSTTRTSGSDSNEIIVTTSTGRAVLVIRGITTYWRTGSSSSCSIGKHSIMTDHAKLFFSGYILQLALALLFSFCRHLPVIYLFLNLKILWLIACTYTSWLPYQ